MDEKLSGGVMTRLQDASMALYMAGRWILPDHITPVSEQAKLWEDLRRALGLEEGHSTRAGVNKQDRAVR